MTKSIKTIDSKLIKKLAIAAGFDDCGISPAKVNDKDYRVFVSWINSGKNAGMRYLSKNTEIRMNPGLLVDDAQTVISVILSYKQVDKSETADYLVSKYARGYDYHHVMKSKLKDLEVRIKDLYPGISTRVFTDSAPVLERSFARQAGLGFIGKNTCLIHPKLGSMIFIGELVCDYISEYDTNIKKDCGDCDLCVKSCPVGALSLTGGLDANKCISYHTVENSGDIPDEIAQKINNQVFGCDICQDVCPYNSDSPLTKHKEFYPLNDILELNLEQLEKMTNTQFKKRYLKTSLYRAGKRKLTSNFKLISNKSGK
jgi:epoxyqueuosine reductase